jgi:hypothetical protein
MPEAGLLLLLLFLGVCSLIVVAVLWPSFRRVHDEAGQIYQIGSEAHAFISQASAALTTPPQEDAPKEPIVKMRMLSVQAWLEIVNQKPDDAPHTLIIGTSGSGKTTLAEAIVSTRAGKVAILDPKWTPGKWGNLPAIPIDDDGKYTQIEAAAKSLLAELNDRLVSLKRGVTTFTELTIVVEELPTVIDECPSGAALLKQIGRLGRELRIRLLGLSQSERVKSLGIAGEGDTKDNYLLIRLGKFAIALMPESRGLNRPAVLEWQGEHYLMHVDGILHLSRYPQFSSRSWAFPSGVLGLQKQDLKLVPKQTQKPVGGNSAGALFLTFSAEELGKVAMLIIKGVERGKAIRAMPRYTRKQHKEFAAFFDALKEAMAEAQKDG